MAAGKKRIYLLDELRGLAVFCMVFYHAFYSMSEFFNIAVGTKLLDFFTPAEPFFAALFIVISGISSRLSHNNTKRGVRLLCVALALTVVTAVIMPMMQFEGAEIYFGILHLLSLSMLIFSAQRAGLDKINTIVGIIICIAIYIFTYGVSAGYVGIAGLKTFNLPAVLYRTNYFMPLGFFNSSFHSADYFPLLPWGGLFWAGCGLGQWLLTPPYIDRLRQSRSPGMARLGRHTLALYLCHQPVWFAGLWLLRAVHG